jgi:subtilisin family serine protease
MLTSAACGDVPSAPPVSANSPANVSGAALAVAAPGTPLVLVFNANRFPDDVGGFVAAAGGTLLHSFPEVGLAVARANDAGFSNRVRASHAIQAVGPVGRWTAPGMTPFTPALGAPTAADAGYEAYQWDIRRVGADQAWAAGFTGSHNTVVAIIDQGIDATHPDLSGNVVFQACIELAGFCGDAFRGDHGTHVAGTVAAAFDGGLAVGVGPNLGLAGYQVFETSGEAWDPSIWWALLDAAERGFRVANMSLSGYAAFGQSKGFGAAVWTAWNRVIDYVVRQGVVVVAAAGNEAVDVNGTLYHLPGDLPGIINVAATGIEPYPFFPQPGAYDIRAFYSNTGAAVTLSAPGGDCGAVSGCSGITDSGYPFYYEYLVFSTIPLSSGGYAWGGGTSQATPHVAAAAGLMLDANPRLNPYQVAAILKRTADPLGNRQVFGAGMLDVLEAVLTAAN